MKKKIFLVILSIVLILCLFVSCKQKDGDASGQKLKFYVVTHGGPADPFWGVVMKGAKEAGDQYKVDVTYLGPEKFSIQELVNMLETAIAAKPNGIVVTITDVNALDKPLKDAIAQGIPVIAINVPDSRSFDKKIPYLAYVGADDYKVGIDAAQRMISAFGDSKPKKGVILVHEVGHAGLEARAKGITEIFTQNGIPVERLAGSPNASENYQVLDAYLTKYPNTDAVFTLGPLGAEPSIKVIEDKKLTDKVKLGAVDLSDTIINAIKDNKIEFTVEQQQYLQGYLPVAMLTLYNKYGLIPHDDILTGPAIVDKNNVAIVEKMVSQKYR